MFSFLFNFWKIGKVIIAFLCLRSNPGNKLPKTVNCKMECESSGLIRTAVPMKICESPKNFNFVLFSSKIVGLQGSHYFWKHPKILYSYHTLITFFTRKFKITTDRVPQGVRNQETTPLKTQFWYLFGITPGAPHIRAPCYS